MGYWKYKIVHDYNATQLIKEFREENTVLKNSKGTEDDELDFIMYAEKDDFSISLGRVLLIKMSDAMVKYHHEYKGKENLPKYWAKYIYEQCKNNQTFWFTEEEIAEAFSESIQLQTQLMLVSALEVQNFIKKVTENLSESFREDELFSREQWDPTLKSDEYLFAQPENAINYFIEKCDSLKKSLKKVKDQLEIIKSFKIADKEIKIKPLEKFVKSIDEQIKSIEHTQKWLTENRDEAKLMIPFLCGVWNGLVEFIAGFIDLAFLAINIAISDVFGGEPNLELLEIREGVEEALKAIVENPSKVFNDAIETIEKYKHSRYNDPKLNNYQKLYNAGEDTVLAIDLVITIATIIKGIAKLAQKLPKFTKWVDDVLAKNGKGARKLENALLKLRKVAYGESELSKIAIQFRKTLGKAKRHNGNIAVIEYLDEAGKIKRKEFTTLTESEWKALGYSEKPHAEEIMIDWILDNNLSIGNVNRIYSELEPCGFKGHTCKDKLEKLFPDAIKEYSYDYPGKLGDNLKTVRDTSLKERAIDMNKLVK